MVDKKKITPRELDVMITQLKKYEKLAKAVRKYILDSPVEIPELEIAMKKCGFWE